MRKICCVNDCPEVSEHKELYSLPSQYRLKQSWLAKVRDKINGHSVELNGNQVQICHLHFKLEDFALVLNIDRTITKHLDRNAIPSVFPQNAHEWDKNFISHQQLDQAHKGSSSALNDSTVASSEENAVQLGNVESLGIISSDENEEQATLPLEKSTQAALPPSQKSPACSSDIASKKFVPRLGNSPTLPSRLQYSCTNCDFKTTDAILLRDHREKQHSKERDVEAIERKKYKEEIVTPTKNSTPISDGHLINQNLAVQKSTESTVLDDDIEHLCVKCSFVTTNLREFIAHQRIHDSEGSSTEELSERSEDENTEKENVHNALCNPTDLERAQPEKVSAENRMYEENDYVYCCPICEFWARSIVTFHSHLVVSHNKSGTFKCSRCDFTSVNRRSISKHVTQMQRLGGGHDDAVWAMVAAAENLDYSHYLKPAASLKFQHEKHAVLDARDFNGLDNEPAAMELDPSPPSKERILSANNPCIEPHGHKRFSNSASDYTLKPKSEETIAVGIVQEISIRTVETSKHPVVEERSLSVKKNTPLRKILRLCRLNQGNVSKLVARKKSTQEKLDLLLVTKERSNLDERTLLEHKESIRQRASTLSKEKIQTEIDVRKYQCEILRHRLTLLKSPSEDEANLVQTAITELENICQQLEAKLKSTQHEIQEFELQASTCLQQHKEITDSNAGIEQLISITQSEMDDDESRLSALRKERIILQERLRRAISEERSRIKIATTVQRAKAACDYKKRLLLLQEKERKRLRNLDRLLNDCNIET